LPFVRVVDQNDIVAMLPDSTHSGNAQFAQIGTEITNLLGPYYALLPPAEITRKLLDQFANDTALSACPITRSPGISRTWKASSRVPGGEVFRP
jgi:hypothetical protein